MINWRKIKNNRIQTNASKVWLWDCALGVAAECDVPSRPWSAIPSDFTHWSASKEAPTWPPVLENGDLPYVDPHQASEMLAKSLGYDDEEDDIYVTPF